jgi:hypothetical protein
MFEMNPLTGVERYPELVTQQIRGWEPLQRGVAAAIASGALAGDATHLAHVFWAAVHGIVSLHLAGTYKLIEEDLDHIVDAMETTPRGNRRDRRARNNAAMPLAPRPREDVYRPATPTAATACPAQSWAPVTDEHTYPVTGSRAMRTGAQHPLRNGPSQRVPPAEGTGVHLFDVGWCGFRIGAAGPLPEPLRARRRYLDERLGPSAFDLNFRVATARCPLSVPNTNVVWHRAADGTRRGRPSWEMDRAQRAAARHLHRSAARQAYRASEIDGKTGQMVITATTLPAPCSSAWSSPAGARSPKIDTRTRS